MLRLALILGLFAAPALAEYDDMGRETAGHTGDALSASENDDDD